MLKDIIIIIPTHKRQHNLKRLVWYYSQFDCDVYICDSTPEQQGILSSELNIHYLWCPDKNFYQKLLYVVTNTNAQYYALSPDDDFLKKETLIECYEHVANNPYYSMALGRQIHFADSFSPDTFYYYLSANRLDKITLESSRIVNNVKLWSHYQNLLWSLFRKDTLVHSLNELIENEYKCQNYIELTLGMKAICSGYIYTSKLPLNFREDSTSEHWGSREITISLTNLLFNKNLRRDTLKFVNTKKYRGLYLMCIVIYIFTKPFLRIHRGLRKLFGLSPTLCFQDESMRVLLKKVYSIK